MTELAFRKEIRMRFILALCTLIIFFTGCATAPPIKEDKELNALVKALVKNNEEMKKKWTEQEGKGIIKLLLDKNSDTVSAELDKALVEDVTRKLLDQSGKPWMLDKAELGGKITASFDNIPFQDALNLILKPAVLSAETVDGVVIIKTGFSGEASEKTDAEIALENISAAAATQLLEGIFPEDPATGGKPIHFGNVAASNTIYLNGPPNEVARALQLLMKADREIEHVVIEVLVIEFATGALEELGTKIQNLQDGMYNNINMDFSGMSQTGNMISFSQLPSDATKLLTSFDAAINFLVSDNKARLISRPYIGTLSGQKAQINIASDRYVIVNEANGSVGTQSIQAGVILDITPTVMADGKLRMEIKVEDSQFSSVNVANVSTEVNKNSADTVMQVRDGETIIIGGMMLNRKAWGNSGFPWLRHIPIVNWVFASQENVENEKEVAIYVTPHVWKPNMRTPIIDPDALTIKEGEGVGGFIQRMK